MSGSPVTSLRLVAANDHNTQPEPASDEVPPPPPPANTGRSLDAKRINECLKHFNGLLNTLAAAVIGTTVIVPFVKDPNGSLDATSAQWCAIAAGLHIFPYVLNFLVMQSEE